MIFLGAQEVWRGKLLEFASLNTLLESAFLY
jgi:hypothetical protein